MVSKMTLVIRDFSNVWHMNSLSETGLIGFRFTVAFTFQILVANKSLSLELGH